MKNQQIQDAYDSINPDAAAMERMARRLREALPEDNRKSIHYSAKPERENHWAVIPAAAACLAVLLLGSFVLRLDSGKQEDPELDSTPVSQATETTVPTREATEPVTEPVAETEPTQPTVSVELTEPSGDTPFGPGDYLDYVTWIRNRNSTLNRANSERYVYYDLNADGIKDLLIGDKDGWISEAVTCIDGELMLLFSIGNDFRVCENGALVTGREGDTEFMILRLSGLEHFVSATIWLDEEAEQWYFYVSAMDETRAITEADAMEILESYVPVDLTMGKLSSFQVE